MLSRSSLSVFSFFVLGACSSSGSAFARLDDPPALRGKSVEVRLTDGRAHVDEAVDVPMMSFPGQDDEQSPPLEPNLANMIQFTLQKHLAAGERALRVHVNVLEAVAGWEGGWLSESETASARVAVEVWDAGANRLLASGVGEATAEKSSLDTNEGRVQRILSTAVQGAALEYLASEPVRAALSAP